MNEKILARVGGLPITEEDLNDPKAIAEKLGDAGLVKYPDLFELFYRFKLNNSNKNRPDDDKIKTLSPQVHSR